MTAQTTYQADDDHLVRANDQAISEDSLIEPEASLAVPESDLAGPDAYMVTVVPDADLTMDETELAMDEPDVAEPDTDLAMDEPDLADPDADLVTAEPDTGLVTVVPDADLTMDEPDLAMDEPDLAMDEPDLAMDEPDLAEPGAEQTAHEDLTSSHPADAVALADSEPATSIVSGYPGFIPDDDDRAAEPELADSSPDSLSLVSAVFTVPESVTDSHSAANTASAAGPWNEVQAMFVDDPHASIERAAGLVDERVEELIQTFRERQSSIQSAWQADDAGTEELRVALQHYRGFWNSLEDLPARD